MSSAGEPGSLPPPLPPAERTVGQLVAEAIQLYTRRFWTAFVVGLGPGLLALALADRGRTGWFVVMWTLGAVLLTASYVGASAIVAGERPEARTLATAYVVGLVVFVPFPPLLAAFALPGLAWLALAGLAVPAAIRERLSIRAALRRGFQLGRADYVHAFASLTTLAVVALLTQTVLVFLLRDQSESTHRTAAFLANLVVSPVVLLGAALLYVDQAARVRLGAPTEEEPDADVHSALDAEHAGRPDVEVESRPAAGGQP